MNTKRKENLSDFGETEDDTRISEQENPIFLSAKSKNNTYDYYSNINNIINQNDNNTEINIKNQRENRRIISLIKKILQKKEDEVVTKKSIKDLLVSFKQNILLIKDDQNNTLLHIYTKNNDIASLNIILEIYIDIVGINEKFYSYLFMINMKGLTVFDISVKLNLIPIIKLLYQQMEKAEKYSDIRKHIEYLRRNIFNISAENNRIFPIIFFLEKLKNFYKKKNVKLLECKDEGFNKEKMDPILYSAKNRNLKLLLILIDLGANIDSQNKEGYTPLHFAVANNDERMVKNLLIRGANKFITDSKNVNPYNLAIILKHDNLAQILEHKNCCKKIFCGNEVGKLSRKASMILLISYLVFNIFFKLIIFFRLFFVINDISFDLTDFKIYIGTHGDNLQLIDFFECLDDKCISELTIFFLCTAIDLLLLVYFIFFKCSKKVFLPKNINAKYKLSKLFEVNEDICIKCGITKTSTTKHCLICDRCVNNWDHHCYWLNTCINNKNYFKFKLFLYFSFVFLIENFIYYTYSLYLILSSKDLFFQEILGLEIYSIAYYIVKIILISVEIFIVLLMIFILIFINLPLIKYACQTIIQNKNSIENIEILIDSDDSFNKIFEGQDDLTSKNG